MSIIEAVWQPQSEPKVAAAKTNSVAAHSTKEAVDAKASETVAPSETVETPSSTTAAATSPMATAVEEIVVLPRRSIEPTGVDHTVSAVKPTPNVMVVPRPVLNGINGINGINHLTGAAKPKSAGHFEPSPVSPGPGSDTAIDKLADATGASPVGPTASTGPAARP